MAKKTPNYTITKRRDGVDIHLSADAYNNLHKELKTIIEIFCKGDVTLFDLGNTFPISMMLMATHEIVEDLKVGDKIMDKEL